MSFSSCIVAPKVIIMLFVLQSKTSHLDKIPIIVGLNVMFSFHVVDFDTLSQLKMMQSVNFSPGIVSKKTVKFWKTLVI